MIKLTDILNEERGLVYRVNPSAVDKFLKKYPKVKEVMKSIISKNKDIMKGYKAFIKFKDKQEDYLGGRAEETSSPTFGTKTFYKYDWNGVDGWAEAYQHLYSTQTKSVKESTKTEYIVWGIPPNKSEEEILYTKAKSNSEARKVCDILTKRHGCKKCRVQTLDLSQDTDLSLIHI